MGIFCDEAMNANYHETAAAAATAVPMEDSSSGDDDNDECPDLVPVAPTADDGGGDGRKVPVTVITGYLGRARTQFQPDTRHLRRQE